MVKQSFLIIREYTDGQTQYAYTGEGEISQWKAKLGKKPSHPLYLVTELELKKDEDMLRLRIYQGYFSPSVGSNKYKEVTDLHQLDVELNNITIPLLQRILQEAQLQQAQGR